MATITDKCITERLIFPYGRNQWVYAEKLTALLRSLESDIAERVAAPLGFKEWIFPNIIRASVLGQYGVTDIRSFSVGDELCLDPLKISLYPMLVAQDLPIPLKVFERNTTFRRENDAREFHTADEFRRMDFYYVGTPAFVLDTKGQFLESFRAYLSELGIVGKSEHGDEGFTTEFSVDGLEIANIGTKKDSVLKRFGSSSGLWAGYASIGVDRLLYALLKTHSVDIDAITKLLISMRREVQKIPATAGKIFLPPST